MPEQDLVASRLVVRCCPHSYRGEPTEFDFAVGDVVSCHLQLIPSTQATDSSATWDIQVNARRQLWHLLEDVDPVVDVYSIDGDPPMLFLLPRTKPVGRSREKRSMLQPGPEVHELSGRFSVAMLHPSEIRLSDREPVLVEVRSIVEASYRVNDGPVIPGASVERFDGAWSCCVTIDLG